MQVHIRNYCFLIKLIFAAELERRIIRAPTVNNTTVLSNDLILKDRKLKLYYCSIVLLTLGAHAQRGLQ